MPNRDHQQIVRRLDLEDLAEAIAAQGLPVLLRPGWKRRQRTRIQLLQLRELVTPRTRNVRESLHLRTIEREF
jgi:hypothetical protein